MKKDCVVQVLLKNLYKMNNQIFEILIRKYTKKYFVKPQPKAYCYFFSLLLFALNIHYLMPYIYIDECLKV